MCKKIPDNLVLLHDGEQSLRDKALQIVNDRGLEHHLAVVELAMDVADVLRKFPTDDEDLKVVQILGMRIFNAFGASLKLSLSGYMQNGALIMRDILETVFLLDLFRGDVDLIREWRFADKKTLKKKFSPVQVRDTLDKRYGHTSKKREALYKLFCEIAAHPTMKSDLMMRPTVNGDAVIGPFVEADALQAQLSEMARLAIQAGGILLLFVPTWWGPAMATRSAFNKVRKEWLTQYYGQEH